MKKILLGITTGLVALALFLGVAHANDWLNFSGDEQIEQSHDDLEKIMTILRDVQDGKITAEQATDGLRAINEQLSLRVQELEDMNPSGLAKLNKELREEVKKLKSDNAVLTTDLASANKAYTELQTTHSQATERIDELEYQKSQNSDYVEHLEAELTRANEQVQGLNNKTSEALEEAKQISGGK